MEELLFGFLEAVRLALGLLDCFRFNLDLGHIAGHLHVLVRLSGTTFVLLVDL